MDFDLVDLEFMRTELSLDPYSLQTTVIQDNIWGDGIEYQHNKHIVHVSS